MVFSAFSKTIGNIPVQAVLKTIELECKMVQDDLQYGRLEAGNSALSVLYFGQFIQMVKRGEAIHSVRRLPPDHLEFYRETIVRLVNANELPASTMEQFERAFPVA